MKRSETVRAAMIEKELIEKIRAMRSGAIRLQVADGQLTAMKEEKTDTTAYDRWEQTEMQDTEER